MSTPPMNFQKAIYEGDTPAPDQCAYCGRGIASEYFRVGGHLACPICAQKAQSLVAPDSHKVFMHALSYGAAAALLGCAGYALITILSGWSIGYAAVGVGYVIGWAMRRAAKQHGGRRYQIAAALLTYAAVAVAFVPIQIHNSMKEKASERDAARGAVSSTATPGGAVTDAPKESTHMMGVGEFALGILELLGVGLISPFLELTASTSGGLLNLFIIFIGVRFAWQMMAAQSVDVEGPFEAVPTVIS
jgi:uncharacterized membrane protein